MKSKTVVRERMSLTSMSCKCRYSKLEMKKRTFRLTLMRNMERKTHMDLEEVEKGIKSSSNICTMDKTTSNMIMPKII